MQPGSHSKNLKKSTLSGFSWQITSYITQAVMQVIVVAVLARLLTPEDFGLLGIAIIVVDFAALFSQLGVGPALIQRVEITAKHIRAGFTLSMILSFLLSLLVIGISPFAAVFLENPQVTKVLSVVSLNFFFAGFGVVAESLIKRDLQFQKLMKARVGSYLLGYALIGITLAFMGKGVWALVWATLGQSLIYSLLLYIQKRHSLLPSFRLHEIRELLFFGGGFTLARMLNYSANQGDYLVVGKMLGTAALGLYTRAYQLMMIPAKYFSQVLATVLFPVMAKLQNEQQRLTKTYLSGIASVALVSAPLGALMIISAPEIVRVVLGEKWVEAIIPFQILTLGVVARASYKIDDALAKALGVMYQRSLRDGIYAAAVVGGALLGLRWGLTGVAIGTLAAVIINYVLAVQMSLRLLHCSFSEFIKALTPVLYPTVVVAAAATLTRALLNIFSLPDWFVLVLTTLLSGLSLFLLFLLRPQTVGVYGIITLKKFLPLLPVKIVPRGLTQWVLSKLDKRETILENE